MLGRQLRPSALIVIGLLTELDPGEPQPELRSRVLRRMPLVGGYLVPEHGDFLHVRERFFDDLQPLFGELDLLKGDARQVGARARQASHIATRERIVIDGDHDDRPRAGRRQGGFQADLRAPREQDVDLVGKSRYAVSYPATFATCTYSNEKFLPSSYPSSAIRSANATKTAVVRGCTLLVPTRSKLGSCCPRTGSGHAAAPPSAAMNTRRLIRSPHRRGRGGWAEFRCRRPLRLSC